MRLSQGTDECVVRGTGQDPDLEAGGAPVLSCRWLLWAGTCKWGCQAGGGEGLVVTLSSSRWLE